MFFHRTATPIDAAARKYHERTGEVICSVARALKLQAFKQGIRIGSVRDGKVLAFIPLTDAAIGSAEEVAADDQGNIFAGFTAKEKMAVRKFVKN